MNRRGWLEPVQVLLQTLVAAAIVLATGACTTLPPRTSAGAEATAARLGAAPAAVRGGGGIAAAPGAATEPSRLAALAAASLPGAEADANGAPSGFRLLPSAEQALDARLALIGAAEHRIDLQLYHLHTDATGQALAQALVAAARRGVPVRLLLDDLHIEDAAPLLALLARQPGIELRLFNPLPARRGGAMARILFSAHEFDRVNRRMHNKLLLVDAALAIFGGRNAGDSYFMRHDGANFVDIDVLAAGAVVTDLSVQFERYWSSQPAWPVEALPGTPGLGGGKPPAGEAAWPGTGESPWPGADVSLPPVAATPARPDPRLVDPLGQSSVTAQLAAGRLLLRPGRAQVHADAPEKVARPVVRYQPGEAMAGLLDALASAEQSLTIVSPYFVPGPVGMTMIERLAERGLRPRIITNSLGATDEPLVHRAYAEYRPAMLARGVRLDELSPSMVRRVMRSGFVDQLVPTALRPALTSSAARLHAKLALIDQRRVLVGSVNLDPRSAVLNTELLVDITSPALALDVSRQLALIDEAGLYRPTLTPDGRSLRWHATADDGTPLVLDEEPHDRPLVRAWQRWLAWLVGELHL